MKNLQMLEKKFDELEREGFFSRLSDFIMIVEHVIPSFLIRKPSGGYGLITAFTSVGNVADLFNYNAIN